MTLYSSELRRKPRCEVASSYSSPSECGSCWLYSISSVPPREPSGEMAVPLPATVQHQDGAVAAERGGQAGRCRVRDMVRHETDARRVQAREGRGQEVRRPLGVGLT